MPKPKPSRFNKFKKIKLPSNRAGKLRLGLFVAAFALIGAYLIFASFAAYYDGNGEVTQYNDINNTRAQYGRAHIGYSACLSNQARAWSQYQSQYGLQDPSTSKLQSEAYACYPNRGGGYFAGQNQGDGGSSQQVFDCFMQECGYAGTTHRDNILDTRDTVVGTGVYVDNNGTYWVTQIFVGCPGCNGDGSLPATYSPPPPPEYKAISLAPCVGGYTLDVTGARHSFNGFGGAAPSIWPNQNVARMIDVDPNCSGQGYILDLYGGIHNFNGAPAVHGEGYWSGQDVARDLKFYNWTYHLGYVLDRLGALHPVNYAPAAHVTGYWSSGDVTRKFAINGAGTGGYTMDYRGGLHPFSIGSNTMPPAAYGGPYWNGDVARGMVLDPNGHGGYVLDYCGGIHPFGVSGYSMPPSVNVSWYSCSADLARDLVVTTWNKNGTGKPGGYVVDKNGGVHLFGP